MRAPSTRLVFVRHGQTDYNREGRLQGQVDIPLNATGVRQAESLAPTITADPPDVIVASPLERARETARLISSGTDVEITTDVAFLERSFGRWEGLKGEEIRSRWPEEHADWRAHRPVRGLDVEDRPEVGERVAAGCRRWWEHDGGTVMVVARGRDHLGITALLGLDTNGSGPRRARELPPLRARTAHRRARGRADEVGVTQPGPGFHLRSGAG